MSATTDDALVSIERLEGIYRVAADHPAPASVRRTLDRLVRSRLEEACGRSLTPLLDPADPSIWLIRDVEVELAVNAAVSTGDWSGEDALVAAWAAEIAERIAALIAAGPDGEQVISYRDRTDLLARFVTDVATGGGGDGWDWPEFTGLRLLPKGRAIREVLVREPEAGTGVLARLAAEGRLEPVLQAMSDADAEAVCARVYGVEMGVAPRPSRRLLERALAAFLRDHQPLPPAGAGGRDTIRLLASGGAGIGTPADIELAAAVHHLRAMASARPDARRLVELLAPPRDAVGPDAAATPGIGGETVAESVAWLRAAVGGDAGLARKVADAVTPGSSLDANGSSSAFSTPFGGVYLLLPSLIELDLCLERAAASPGMRRAVCGLAALQCLGGCHAESALADPAVQVALALGDDPSLEDVVGMLDGQSLPAVDAAEPSARDRNHYRLDPPPPPALASELARFAAFAGADLARRLPGFERSSAPFLQENVLAGLDTVVVGDDELRVNLGPRPLDVVLRIAGFHGRRLRPAWVGREVVLE